MIENFLLFLDAALLLIFGIFLSSAFAGIRMNKRNMLILGVVCVLLAVIQIGAYCYTSGDYIRKLYPPITHLPVILFYCLYYHKRFATAIVSVFTAYLCCQPVKFVGILVLTLTHNVALHYAVRIILIVCSGYFLLKLFAPSLSEIYNKDTRSIYIFGSIPLVYYLLDYAAVVYTSFWHHHILLIGELFPALLCYIFVIFCVIYYRTYEQKADAERKEQIVRTIAEQRTRQIDALKRSEKEIRMLRHDMRLLLSSVSVCLDNEDPKKAQDLIASYSAHIEGTTLLHFCSNDTINYVLSDFSAKCTAKQVRFLYTVDLKQLHVDEILFASILSNALDNALNAQEDVSAEQRVIQLMLKYSEGKILVSVKNPIAKKPVFIDGLPITDRSGHGYGTQSIHYLTERLGGNCQFSILDDHFLVRIVI